MLNNFLLILAGLLALVLAALFAVPMAIDWNQYRSVFEQHATRLLGREVRVGEGVNLRLLPSPYVRFENVRIADSTGRFDRPLARIDGFTLWLSVAPLLRGEIEANAVELTGPELRLSMDQNGQGNWFGLGLNGAELPFMPRDVSLKAVSISEGRLRLVSSNGVELLAYDKINGELSSPAIHGPYRFQGTLEEAGVENEVRISTLKFAEQAPLGFKAAIRVPARGRSYEFDGALHDVMTSPHIDGALSGRIVLAANALGGTDATLAGSGKVEGDEAGTALASPARIVELRSKVEADPTRLRLSDLALTFDSVGKPQALGGEVLVGWHQGTVVAGELKARWLDLDTILGVDRSAKLQPWRAVAGLVREIGMTIPPATRAQLSFSVDQATLGADAVGPLRLELTRAGGKTSVQAFEAAVPGGAHISIAGSLIENQGLPGFQGPVRLRGASLSRFLAWLEPNLINIDAGDGAFLLSANVEADDRRLAFSRAFGEIAGSGFKGAMEYRARADDGSGRAKLILDLDSDKLDISTLARLEHVTAPVRDLLRSGASTSADLAAGERNAGGGAAEGGLARNILDLDSSIDLRIGRLQLADGRLRDVSVNMRLANGNLDIPQIRFESDDGMSLDLSGKATGVGTNARGKLQFAVVARDAAAIELLAGAFGSKDALPADAQRLADFAPLRLAGTVELGVRDGGAMQVSLDGISGPSRAIVMARVEGAGALIDRDIDLRATLSADNGINLLSQIAPHMRGVLAADAAAAADADNAIAVRGVASLRAVGVPASGMLSALTIETADISARFSGDTRWADGVPTVTGEAEVRSPRGQRALALGGLDRFFDAHGDELEFVTQIERRDGGYDLRAARLSIGEREMTGGGRVQLGDGTTRFDLALEATQLRLGELLAFAVRPPAKTAAQRNDAAAETAPADIWSKHAFDFSPLNGLEGKIALRVDTLEIADGLSIGDARLDAALAPSGLKVSLDEAQMLNGRVSGSGTLARRSAGARLEGSLDLVDVDLGAISERSDLKGRLLGRLNAHLELASQGLSPRGLAAVLTGRGQVGLRQAGIGDLDPGVIDKVADIVLAGSDNFDADTLRNLLLQQAPGATYMLGDQSVAVEVVDGNLKLAPIEAETQSSHLRIASSVDLADLVVQSEWRLTELSADSAAREEITPLVVGLLYSGDLVDATRLEPVLDVDTLERELAFRKIVRERIDRPSLQLDSGELTNGSLSGSGLPSLTLPSLALPTEGVLVPRADTAPAAAGLAGVERIPLPALAPTAERSRSSTATAGTSNSAATITQPRLTTGQGSATTTRDDDIWRSIVVPR